MSTPAKLTALFFAGSNSLRKQTRAPSRRALPSVIELLCAKQSSPPKSGACERAKTTVQATRRGRGAPDTHTPTGPSSTTRVGSAWVVKHNETKTLLNVEALYVAPHLARGRRRLARLWTTLWECRFIATATRAASAA